jgi:hypothetical protein
MVYRMECSLETFKDYFYGSIGFDNVNLRVLYDRILTVNICKMSKNPDENIKKCFNQVESITEFDFYRENDKKEYFLQMFNQLYDNGHYGYATLAYISLLKLGDYSNLYDKFFIKILDENCIEDRFYDILNYDGDENVEFLKNLIRFRDHLVSKVKHPYIGI